MALEPSYLEDAAEAFKQGNFQSAIALYLKASSIRADSAFQAYVLSGIAQCYRRMGDYGEAVRNALAGLDYVLKDRFSGIRGELLVCLGNSQCDLGNWTEGVESLVEARAVLAANERLLDCFHVDLALARGAVFAADLARAEAIYRRLRVTGYPVIVAQASFNLAVMLSEVSPVESRMLFAEALDASTVTGDRHDRFLTLFAWSVLESKIGRKEDALRMAREAREIALSSESPALLAHAVELQDILNAED